jgi:hypothetical protein
MFDDINAIFPLLVATPRFNPQICQNAIRNPQRFSALPYSVDFGAALKKYFNGFQQSIYIFWLIGLTSRRRSGTRLRHIP